MALRLNRTGLRPLEFEGKALASASSRTMGGQDYSRWHELKLFQHDDGRYIVATAYRTQWQGEHDHDDVIVCNSPEEVEEQIRITSPVQYLVGFPIGEQYRQKQERIEADLSARFAAISSDVLEVLGPKKI